MTRIVLSIRTTVPRCGYMAVNIGKKTNMGVNHVFGYGV